MKKIELKNLIKEAVREELRSYLPKLISELGTKQINEKPTDIVEETKKSLLKVRKTETKPLKSFSKNHAINQILNETVGGIPQEGSMVSSGQEVSFSDTNGNQVDVNALPDHLSSALTRNYTDVMKLVDKKRGKIT